MDLYLMQHGEAVDAQSDPLRPLSEKGRQSVSGVAGHAASCGVRIDRIVHSGKLRAEQTALILADSLFCTDVSAHSGLGPKDPVEEAAVHLVHPGVPSSLAIVGHLPFLDRLAAFLVAGDPAVRAVAFHNGGLVHLVPAVPDAVLPTAPAVPGKPSKPADLRGRFAVSWALVPELLSS